MNSMIDGTMFVSMLREGTRNLSANKQLVNDLNVFPIPDGDTGDNMLMTISSGYEASASHQAKGLYEVAEQAARGMLMGARGNSGVILSRIFAGIAAGFTGSTEADIKLFGQALECGVRESYKSVSVPVEGTMLTVYREAVEYANSRLTPESTFDTYFDDMWQELKSSLEHTPELLAVLKEAGVVDSGGAGIMYIVEGMVRAFRNEIEPDEPEFGSHSAAAKKADFSLFDENSTLEFGYCTEFLLRLQNSKTSIDDFDLDGFISYLNSQGDSVVCFRDGSIVKAHVHTMRPGDILNHCQSFGEFLTLKIENMTLQHNENTPGASKSSLDDHPELKFSSRKKFAFVTVAIGDGIKETFTSLGVDQVVDGGQSMNPSVEDFIKAFEKIDAEHILVFPNNKNIIMTAEQAASIYDKADVRIVRTRTIGEGYCALSMIDVSSCDIDEIVKTTEETGQAAVTGTVSVASRDSTVGGIPVCKGHYIGFVGEKIYVDDPDREAAAERLSDELGAGDCDVVLILKGSGVSEDKARELLERLEKKYRRTEFIIIDGGQPVADYILIFE